MDIKLKFISDLFTNIGHIILASFVISNIVSSDPNYLTLCFGLVLSANQYLWGYYFILKGGTNGR